VYHCHFGYVTKLTEKEPLIWVVNEMYARVLLPNFWISRFNSPDTTLATFLDTCLGVKSSFLSFPNSLCHSMFCFGQFYDLAKVGIIQRKGFAKFWLQAKYESNSFKDIRL
jgi:hypothetical protein